MTAIKLMYLANIFVAGWISITSLFFPKVAQTTVFTNAFAYLRSHPIGGGLMGSDLPPFDFGYVFPKTNEPGVAFSVNLQIVLVALCCTTGHYS